MSAINSSIQGIRTSNAVFELISPPNSSQIPILFIYFSQMQIPNEKW